MEKLKQKKQLFHTFKPHIWVGGLNGKAKFDKSDQLCLYFKAGQSEGGFEMVEEKVGDVSNFWNLKGGSLKVAGVTLTQTLRKGDRVKFTGSAEFEQTVESMQVNRVDVESAEAEQEIGLQVSQDVAIGDEVYRITEEAAE